jgi:hypothetical protein
MTSQELVVTAHVIVMMMCVQDGAQAQPSFVQGRQHRGWLTRIDHDAVVRVFGVHEVRVVVPQTGHWMNAHHFKLPPSPAGRPLESHGGSKAAKFG